MPSCKFQISVGAVFCFGRYGEGSFEFSRYFFRLSCRYGKESFDFTRSFFVYLVDMAEDLLILVVSSRPIPLISTHRQ